MLAFPLYSYAQTGCDTVQAEIILKHAMDCHLNAEYDSALGDLQRAGDIFLVAKRWERYVHCLNMMADCLSRKANFDSMAAVLRLAQSVSMRNLGSDNIENASTLSLLGLLNIYKDELELAVHNIEDGKRIREKRLDSRDRRIADSDYLLGSASIRKGDFNSALDLFSKALSIYRLNDSSDNFNRCLTLLGMGYALFLQSNFDAALDYFLQAYDIVNCGERKYMSILADCDVYLGSTYYEKGDIERSANFLNAAIKIYRKLFGCDNLFLASCYSRLGLISEAEGDLEKAIDYYEKAISLNKQYVGDNHLFIAIDLRQLSHAYAEKNDLDHALAFSKKALSIHQRVSGKNHPELAYTYEILANIYKKRHQYSLSLRNFNKALKLRSQLKDSNDRNDIANLYSEIGSVFSATRNFGQALAYYNRALYLHNKLPEPNRPNKAAVLKGIGDVYESLKQPSTALRYYQQSLSILVPGFTDSSVYANPSIITFPNSRDLIGILTSKSLAFEQLYKQKSHDARDLRSALATYEYISGLLDAMRKTIATENSKLFLQEQSYLMYQNAIRLCLTLSGLTKERTLKESAFHFAENSKANVLLDGLLDSEAKRFAGVPDSIIQAERSLKVRLAFNTTQLQKEEEKRGSIDTAKIMFLQDQCFACNNEEENLYRFLENNYPKYYDLKYENHIVSIDETQNAIDDQTAIVEYCLTQKDLAVFVITKTSCKLFSIALPPAFNSLVSSFYRSIKTVEELAYVQNGSKLYNSLIQPIKKAIVGKKRLIIIPDGVLYYIPFEALIANSYANAKGSIDFTKIHYLLNNYEISYSYSSSFYVNHIRQKALTVGQQSFVGFAPVFRDSDSNGVFSSNTLREFEKDKSAYRSITVDGKKFNELKYSAQEVSAVAQDFQKTGLLGLSFLYNGATEENFKSNVGKYSCIHIATHGYINEEHPQLSMLLFSQTQRTPAIEDGVLYASETYNLNLKADLVVLSSCESGLGKLVKGEGMMAMTRGFFYSGARNVIFSLWKVYDRPTNKLMRDFYNHVLDGETFTSALRKSKLRLIADRTTAFPTKWSGFILVGD
ncbi:MAG TPA: CHAT domain-containing tetratricopeptide repeat protein [Bacteroidota bacterium]|nr:CHAT domain-containing tetratricopeptide repeat protein [Bacteroidota bacterium]